MSDHSNSVKLGEIIQEFGLEILHPGANYASIPLTTLDVNRPGLPLTGFFEHFDPRRLVVIGLAETTFLEQMDADLRRERFDQMLEYSVPALILTRGLEPCPECMEMAEKHDRTVLRTQAHTSAFMSALIGSLYNYLAPQITRSGVMMEIYGEGVLFQGESGVGKELIADAIYRTSSRAEKPFIKVNCASIPASLFESELFGYERGSFSGANASGKQGLFEAANNGTLLLDEIGEMPMDMQAKLLRAIQNNEITRVGGIRPIKLDIRYIASTNCDLKKKVREGTFRSDLYYRLHVIPIQVPPLREREGDVARLSQHFVSEFNKQYHKNVVLSPENIELLENYSWPGNIRELRNVMEYLVVCCAPNGHVDNSYIYGTFDLSNQNAYVEYDPDQSLNDAITAYEKKYLENALRYARNLKEASQILNIDPSTVSRKLRQHGLTLQGK